MRIFPPVVDSMSTASLYATGLALDSVADRRRLSGSSRDPRPASHARAASAARAYGAARRAELAAVLVDYRRVSALLAEAAVQHAIPDLPRLRLVVRGDLEHAH